MPQINSGKSPPWVSGEIVTAAGLNRMIDAATLDPSAITSQTNLTTLTGDEYALVVDTAGLLKKTQLKNSLLTGEDIKTDSITQVTGSSAILTIESNAGVNTLIYSGGMLSLESGNGTQVNITSMGASLTGTINLEAGNGMTFDGNTGTIDFLSPVSFTGSIQGTANFTGTLQVNGTVGYMLTEIVEENISYTGSPAASVWTNCFTSSSYTKPAGEIWVIEVDFRFRTQAQVYTVIRLNQTSSSTTLNGVYNIEGGGMDYFHCENAFLRYVVSDATTFTSTFTLDVQPSNSGYVFTIGEATFPYSPPYFTGVTLPVSKFRIYKYKTA